MGEDVPITAITNGVHLLTWMDPIWLQPLLDHYLGPGLDTRSRSAEIWEPVEKIPDSELWWLRMRLKSLLIDEINERARERWQKKRVRAESVIAFGALLEPEIFTIGFARRFTSYKRPDLFLNDIDRLKRLLTTLCARCRLFSQERPTLRTSKGRRSFKRVFHLAQDPELRRADRLRRGLRSASCRADGTRRRYVAE